MGSCAVINQCCKSTIDVSIDVNYSSTNHRSRTCISHSNLGQDAKPIDLALEQNEDYAYNSYLTINRPAPHNVNSNKNRNLQISKRRTPIEEIQPKPRLTSKYIYEGSFRAENQKESTVKVNDSLSIEQELLIKKVLNDYSLVCDFDDDTLDEFVYGFFSIEISSNHIIFKEGEESKVFYIIEEGFIKLENQIDHSELICSRGDFFGIEAFEENTNRIQTATSMQTSKLLGVSGEFYRSALTYMDLRALDEKLEIIKNVSLFQNIEKSKQLMLCKQLTLVEYKPNSIVINENEGQDRVFIIFQGIVRVTRKFKKIFMLEPGGIFCHMGLFMKLPCYYTYSVDKEELIAYELLYSDIKEVLGVNYIKDILFELFKKALQASERINDILFQHQNELFSIFKLLYYEKGSIVFSMDPKMNKKICVIISGQLTKSQNKEIVARTGDLYGHEIIDLKENITSNIISEEEALILEASWDEIIRESDNYTTNKIGLSETVSKLKKIPLFLSFKETQYYELAKNITLKEFEDNEVISREGEIADKFYIIKTGKVQMYQKSTFIRNLDVGGCFGEIPNLTGEIRLFTVIAIGSVECYVLTKEDFNSFNLQLSLKLQNFSSLNDIKIELYDLYFVKTLGNGRYGQVLLVHNQKHFYALKYSQRKPVCKSKDLMKYYLNEKEIMLQLDHPFIVKLVKTLKNDHFLFFLLEYIDGITLKTFLEKKRKNKQKTTFEAEFYGGILLNTVNYLHGKKILHRDIKPDNCMIDKTGYLKLIDFGIAKDIKDLDFTSTICGTPHYLAPEVIIGKGYTFSSDFWSIGVTMFEIFYGYVPFGQSAKDVMGIYYDIINKKLTLPYDPKFNDINSFFRTILSKNQLQRVCNYQLLKSHPFFHHFNFEQLTMFSIAPPYIPDSYIEHNSNSNNNIISSCHVSITNYMKDKKSDRPFDEENANPFEEMEKKFLEDF